MLEGIYAAHPDMVKLSAMILLSGHYKKFPEKSGLPPVVPVIAIIFGLCRRRNVGRMFVGDVFQSPSAEQMLAVTKEIDSGAGVLYIYGNYGGDILNFDMAAEMADFEENIHVESVVAGDDVASGAPVKPGAKNTRRGVAGIFFIYKCAGAAAAKMLPLEEVKRVAEKVCENVRTMGVALTPCTVPRVGHPSFELAEDEMEIGMGIHGEPGIRRGKLLPADAIVDEMLNQIIDDLPYRAGDEVAVLVNGLGATPLEEQYVMFRRIDKVLSEKGIKIFHSYVGEYATSLEMAGASISLFKLDDELKELLRAPADTPFFKQFRY